MKRAVVALVLGLATIAAATASADYKDSGRTKSSGPYELPMKVKNMSCDGAQTISHRYFLAEFSEIHYEVRESIDAGDDVIANLHIRGQGKTSGADFELSAWWAFTIRDRKIVRCFAYLDRDRALEAIGLDEQTMSQENVEIVRGVLQAVQAGSKRGDPAAWLDSAAVIDEVEWIPTSSFPGPRSYRGREGSTEFTRNWTEGFNDWSFEIERLIGSPDGRVVALIHQTAIVKGSGAAVDQDLGQVFEVEDGRVIRIRNFLTHPEALEAAGLSDQAMSQENVETVRRMWDAYGREDVPAFLAEIGADVITRQTHPIPDARIYHGHDGVLRALSDYAEAFDEFVMTAREFTDAENGKVMVRVHQKALGAESGVPVEGEYWFVFTLTERKSSGSTCSTS